MALSLVEGMSEEWKPEQYKDTYRDDVLALVKKKIKAGQTKTITAAEPEAKEAKPSNVVDLVALLQDSLGKRPGKAPAKKAAPAERSSPAKAKPAAAAKAKAKAKPATKAAPARAKAA